MLPEALRKWIEDRKLAVAAVLLGLVGIGAGVWWWRTEEVPRIEILSSQDQALPGGETAEKLAVDVAGAVAKPGVYELAAGSRMGEALEAAGGLTEEADASYVDMYLNRADKVKDGQKIYIPSINQNSNVKSQNYDKKVKNLTNINEATQAELEGLPGVGPVTAGKIIAGRPYSVIEELQERKIVSNKVYDGIKELVKTW